MKKLGADEFREAARSGGARDAVVLHDMAGAPQPQAGSSRTLKFVFSDGSVDRAGDRIDPRGWQLSAFKKNSVALWAHDSYNPPIGRARNVGVVGNKLVGDIEFAPPETYPFADVVYRLTKDGYVNAVSVGFRPLEWQFSSDKGRPLGIDFKVQELLEISLAPVPCNSNALIEARAKGIDTRPLLKSPQWARAIEARREQRVAEAAAIARSVRRMVRP